MTYRKLEKMELEYEDASEHLANYVDEDNFDVICGYMSIVEEYIESLKARIKELEENEEMVDYRISGTYVVYPLRDENTGGE